MSRRVFIICPVRNVSPEVSRKIEEYVRRLESLGFQVHWPQRDTDQADPTGGVKICADNATAAHGADEVHVWWDPESKGSYFDLGVFFALVNCMGLRKKLTVINRSDLKASEGKSFERVLLALERETLFTGLTFEEIQTFYAYKKLAAGRKRAINGTPFNPDIWRPEFDIFRKIFSKGRVLDLGCGNGRDALLFSGTSDYEYVGVDISPEMLEEARKLAPGMNFSLMNMYNLSFQSGYFDALWAPASFLHFPKARIREVLTEARRVLKRGAVGFITVKEGEGERMVPGENPGEERFYSFWESAEFNDVLWKSGFEVHSIKRDFREHRPPGRSLVWLLYFVRAT